MVLWGGRLTDSPPLVDRQTGVKALPSRNFVCRRQILKVLYVYCILPLTANAYITEHYNIHSEFCTGHRKGWSCVSLKEPDA